MLLLATGAFAQTGTFEFTTFAGVLSAGNEEGEARFFEPQAIALDAAGNLYVADTNNHTVRRVRADGQVDTLAGTPGQSGFVDGTGGAAQFNRPTGIAVDRAGTVIYVADSGNHTIRRIIGNVVSTFAGLAGQSGSDDGTTAARFNTPGGLAVDREGNLFVADTYNHTIRKVTTAGVVSTVAGAPRQPGTANGSGSAARFKFPSGLALDETGGMYVSDTGSHVIRRIAGGTVTIWAGSPDQFGSVDGPASAARFNGPVGVALDAAGNVFVADTNNHTIRKISASAAVTTLAGTAGQAGTANTSGTSARFKHPRGLAINPAGMLYVADSENHTLRQIAPNGTLTTLAGAPEKAGSADGSGGAPRFETPSGVATDRAGNVYVADTGSHTIRKITASGIVSTLAGAPGLAGSSDGAGRDARFNYPVAVAADENGNLFVADTSNHTIRLVTSLGVVTTLAGAAGQPGSANEEGLAAQFSRPQGIAVDLRGNIYIADTGNHVIRKIGVGRSVTTFAGSAGQLGTADGVGAGARFHFPTSITVDASGDLFVADTGSLSIRKVTSGGQVTTVARSTELMGKQPSEVFRLPGQPALGVVSDGAGGIVIANTYDHTLRRLSLTGGVALLAGSAGQSGSADGDINAARFNSPIGIARDTAGNYFVADAASSTIRKVSSAGAVTTFAGSAGLRASDDQSGATARFNYARGIAVDRNTGNVYVADTGNHTIRKITPAGAVTTFAGTAGVAGTADGLGSAARFEFPRGVAIDAAGNVYVADFSNHTVRKISPSGMVSTLAGTAHQFGSVDGTGAAARFDGPTGIAVDPAGTVYVSDANTHLIRRVTASGVVSTFAGVAGQMGNTDGTGAAARFAAPAGLSIDQSGGLYVCDAATSLIRKITPAGDVTTVVARGLNGSPVDAKFNHPTGVAVDNDGNIYIADTENSTLRKIAAGGLLTTIAGVPEVVGEADGEAEMARFRRPAGIAVDRAGNLYVADTENQTIRKASGTGVVTTLAGTAGRAGSTDGDAALVRFRFPSSTAIDRTGDIYVADRDNHTIRKITATGVLTVAGLAGQPGGTDGPGATARFSAPAGLALDRAGNLYIADTGNHVIRKLGLDGNVTTLAGGPGVSGRQEGVGTTARFNSPNGIAVDSDGVVFVADAGNHSIRRISPSGEVSTLAGSTVGQSGFTDGPSATARFDSPSSVAVDLSGNVFVADYLNHVIRKVSPAGVVTTFAGAAGVSGTADGSGSVARFNFPAGVATDLGGNVYVGDSRNHTIRKISPAGVVTTLAGAAGQLNSVDGAAGLARFYNPTGLCAGAVGEIIVADTGNHSVRRIAGNGDVTTIAGAPSGTLDGLANAARFLFPGGLAVSGVGDIYIADTFNHTVRLLRAGRVTTLAGTAGQAGSADGAGASANFNAPRGLALDDAGNLYVADTDNHTVRKISATGGVTTLAGAAGRRGSADGESSAALFASPEAIAVDNAGNLYIADTGNHTLRRISRTGEVTTVAGTARQPGSANGRGTAARFNAPAGIVIDAAGNLFVADRGNHLLRKISPDGTVSTFAGGTGQDGFVNGSGLTARFSSPSGLAFDGARNLLVADRDNHAIRRVSPSGVVSTLGGAGIAGAADGIAAAARFRFPTAVALDRSENIFVADTYNHTIRRGANVAVIRINVDGGQTLVAGSLLTATATNPTGSIPVGFQWRKDGADLPGQSQQTLTIPNVQPSNAGSYQVVIRYPDENIVSPPTVIDIVSGSYLSNLSVRTAMGLGQTLIVGFSVSGGGRPLLVRGVGPTLSSFGVSGTMADPRIEVYNGTNLVAQNDDWGNSATVSAAATSVGAFALIAGSRDAALLQTVDGARTVQLKGTGAGVVLVELYDTGSGGSSRLVNVSARNQAGTGDNILIVGFVIAGTGPRNLLIRVVGPTLGNFGVTGFLSDPRFTVFPSGSSTPVAGNDNWDAALASTFTTVGAFPLGAGSRDAALATSLPPGAYTVQVSGVNNTTGEALVEIYELP